MALRDYQQKLITDINTAFGHGATGVCAQMPTGGGKSVVARVYVRDVGVPATVVAHRHELVSQLSLHLAAEGIMHDVIASQASIRSIIREHGDMHKRSFYKPGAPVKVASAQTLASRDGAAWQQQCKLLVLDEGHHYVTGGLFARAVDKFPNARKLLFTATPSRTDGKGLGLHADGYCDALVTGPSMRQLIDAGHLSEYEILAPKGDFDRSRLAVGAKGDFTPKSIQEEMERSRIVGDVVQTWLQHASDRQTIVFATSRQSSQAIADAFVAAGIRAAHVDGMTGDYERFTAINAFRSGTLQVLVNVGLFDEGFDVPGVQCVVMARPTQSLGLYLQAVGRGLRVGDDGRPALIIDHVSNVREHGLPDQPRQWSLDGRKRRARADDAEPVIPVTTCESCFMVYERFHRACPFCGAQREVVARNGPEHVDGDLELLDTETLAKLRAAATLESPASVADRVGHAAGDVAGRAALRRQQERIETQEELKLQIAIWAGRGRAAGRSDAELQRLFYLSYGCDVLTAISQPAADMRKLMDKLRS